MAGIFVNYRQRDHAIFVEALAHRLAHHFGRDLVFFDAEMRSGTRYPNELRDRLDEGDVLIAVIHRNWLGDLDDRRAHLKDGEVDWVHFEIATALATGKTVIPALLDDAALPTRRELPEDIGELAMCQATRLRWGSLTDGIDDLVWELERHVAPTWLAQQRTDGKKTNAALSPAQLRLRSIAWSTVAFLAPLPLALLPSERAWTMLGALAWLSTMVMLVIVGLLGVMAMARRRIYLLERKLFAEPARRYLMFALILSLGSLAIMLTIWGTSAAESGVWQSIVVLVLFFGATFWVAVAAVREDRRDDDWPPKVSPLPGVFRRAATRLHERLTTWSDWRWPRSRVNQSQACAVYRQLVNAKGAVQEQANRTWAEWLAADHGRLALACSAWAGSTLGLAVACLLSRLAVGNAPLPVYLLPLVAAAVVGGLVLAAINLGFRTQRRYRRWLVKEIDDWLERLRPLVFSKKNGSRRPEETSL